MEETYLIEIRLARTKWRIRNTILAIAGAFHLEPYMERHPHITLFGPLVLHPGTTPEDLLDTIGRIACGYGPVPFLFNGWEMRQGMHGSVIAFGVIPSKALRDLSRDLAASLCPVADSLNAWDKEPDAKWFHITVANKLETEQASYCISRLDWQEPKKTAYHIEKTGFFGRILIGLKKILHRHDTGHFPPLLLDGTGLRITIMQNDDILAEYDLLEKRWIYGDHSHDSRSWQETLGNYRRFMGFELGGTRSTDEGDIFVIADMHLGHANIIRYCSRPFIFSDCAEMDSVLIRNWNFTVDGNAEIYHVGDLQYGRDAPPVTGYLQQLGGRATFITGNHDGEMPGWMEHTELSYQGTRFFLVHDPNNAPPGFDGWVIHGHHHNNELRYFPFMDFANRRINVSVEVIGYVPVSLREILSRIREHEKSGTTGSLLLRFPHVLPEDTRKDPGR
ncbi:2'-5' RNA ligase family protein [uncultured Methanoregula sp.]|uniref:2'-5' RNA ligase family protein n=1 Tax=uncultured Methanoregula sp. TaxID=1005933 RepID=UPI002AAB65C7|nr:2'-5' RNA ligase family protein [uncultured Methanoregula sp.]